MRAPPGNFTWCSWLVLPNRVLMSISLRTGCHAARPAPRPSVYARTSLMRLAGSGGMPSTARLSVTGMVGPWAGTTHGSNNAAKTRVDVLMVQRIGKERVRAEVAFNEMRQP